MLVYLAAQLMAGMCVGVLAYELEMPLLDTAVISITVSLAISLLMGAIAV